MYGTVRVYTYRQGYNQYLMATVLDIGNEEAFRSKTDIVDFNNRNFPHQPLQAATIEVGGDAMASLRSQMKKRVYVFNQADKESSSMKVAELRNKFIGIKSRIEDARNNQRYEHAKPSYLKLLRELENDADLITNIEGRLL